MRKPFYKHHYSKAIAPLSVGTSAIADYIYDDYAREVVCNNLERVNFTVTVLENPADPDEGEDYSTFEIDDFDMDLSYIHEHMVVLKDTIIQAVEDYIWDHEEEIIGSKAVETAFEHIYEARREMTNE